MRIAALLAVLALRAGAAEPPSPDPELSRKIQAVLSRVEGWVPPSVEAAAELCERQLPARFDPRPSVPKEQARKLDAVFALYQRGVGALCGSEEGCGATEKGYGSVPCETSVKMGFLRTVLSGAMDLRACRVIVLNDPDVEWTRSIPDGEWGDVCRQLAEVMLRKNMTLCSKEGALGRFGADTPEEREKCEKHFLYLKGSAACEGHKLKDPRTGEKLGENNTANCRTAILFEEAFSAGDPGRCGGNLFCLAAMRDPRACSTPFPRAADVLLSEDPSACGEIKLCRQLHAGAANFRRTNEKYRGQLAVRCRVEAETALDRARRSRLDALKEAEADVRALVPRRAAGERGPAREALARIADLTRQADGLVAHRGPPGTAPPELRKKAPERG